jgi:putative ABC transport system ATP-binding protein
MTGRPVFLWQETTKSGTSRFPADPEATKRRLLFSKNSERRSSRWNGVATGDDMLQAVQEHAAMTKVVAQQAVQRIGSRIDVNGVTRQFGRVVVLDKLSLAIEPGEFLTLLGPSGSGKTTLLGLLGGVQTPNRGSVRLLGQELTQLSAGARDRFRVDHTGYIFQQFNLLPFLSVRENVELPCHVSKLRQQRATQRHGSVDNAATTLLAHLGLKDPDMLSRRADSLSIGQQQRVAAARALIGQPELVIADEPTSALDADAREAFIRLLFAECRDAGASLLFVSHDQNLAPLFDRNLSLSELNRAAVAPEV